jgi:hypothetical protein
MRIDQTHRPLATLALILLIVSFGIYLWYAATQPGGARGGTAIGLTFGIVGYALMVFEGLLGARTRVPVWRLGRAQSWMRGHLWLGLLTLPLILFHANFQFRGPLTLALMILFFIVYASGIFGAAMQHYVPAIIKSQVPLETIYEEIPHVRNELREEADRIVDEMNIEVEHEDKVRFKETYQRQIRPFLEAPQTVGVALADALHSQQAFEAFRRSLPAPIHPVLKDLESICEEERQLNRQRRLYLMLHTWLVIHVPLSVALVVLGGVHAVVALLY